MVAVPTPQARSSGLTRPSAVGPLELKPAMSPPRSTAAGEDLQGVGRGDKVAGGGVRVVARVAGGGAAVQSVGGGGVDGDGGDGGVAVEVGLGIPVDVAKGAGGDVAAVGLDELEAADVVVFFDGGFGGDDFGLAEDEGSAVGTADELVGVVGGEAAQDERAVLDLGGVVAGLEVGVVVVVDEVVLGDDGDGVLGAVEGDVVAPEAALSRMPMRIAFLGVESAAQRGSGGR